MKNVIKAQCKDCLFYSNLSINMDKDKIERRVAKRILNQTSYWNGWYISEQGRMETCEKISKSIVRTILSAISKAKPTPEDK